MRKFAICFIAAIILEISLVAQCLPYPSMGVHPVGELSEVATVDGNVDATPSLDAKVNLSYSPSITFNNDGLAINGKKIPKDALGNPLNIADIDGSGKTSVNLSYSPTITFNNDGLVINGKKILMDELGNQLNVADIDGSGKTTVHLSYSPNITFNEGKQISMDELANPLNVSDIDGNGKTSIDFSNSPDKTFNDDDLVTNGPKFPMDSDTQEGCVNYNTKDGLDGKKVSVDALGNQLSAANVDDNENTSEVYGFGAIKRFIGWVQDLSVGGGEGESSSFWPW